MVRIDTPDAEAHDPRGYAARHVSPEIIAAAGGFAMAVCTHARLSLREFEAARIRIAEINGCLTCQQFRSAHDIPALAATGGARPPHLVSDNGPAPDELFYAAVPNWRASSLFSARERIAIEFAERFALEPKLLAGDEDFWSRAKAVFNDGEIVDLAYSVGEWLALGRINHVLGFDTVCAPRWAATT